MYVFPNQVTLLKCEREGIFKLPGYTGQQLLDPLSSNSVLKQDGGVFSAIFEIPLGHRKERI